MTGRFRRASLQALDHPSTRRFDGSVDGGHRQGEATGRDIHDGQDGEASLGDILASRLVGAGANPMNKTDTVGFDATGTIKRSEFGVKANTRPR